MKLYIQNQYIPVYWENNITATQLKEQVKKGTILVSMEMFGGNEQFGPLGRQYASNDTKMTTNVGDIVLYNGNQIVVFYGSNTWKYTKLGKMNIYNHQVIALLSQGNVELKISED